MNENILAKPKPTTIKLSDGKDYILPAMTLNVLANIEEEFDCGIDKLQEQLADRMASKLRKFLKVLLQENYPDITLEQVGKLVSMEDLPTMVDKVTQIITGK